MTYGYTLHNDNPARSDVYGPRMTLGTIVVQAKADYGVLVWYAVRNGGFYNGREIRDIKMSSDRAAVEQAAIEYVLNEGALTASYPIKD